jgi:outer membrane protein assembly factor BamB
MLARILVVVGVAAIVLSASDSSYSGSLSARSIRGGADVRQVSAPAADWPTYHESSSRSGASVTGPQLGQVRHLWTARVDGAVYAEPLIVGRTVIVATENDTVYAFAARSGHRLWRAHLATPVAGGSLPCGNIDPSGITSTPVIDAQARVVYAVTFERGPQHMLVALDLATGNVRWRRPIDPPGADPSVQQQRAALALSHGRVYISYGGLYGDCGDYHGWVVAASLGTPTGGLLFYRVPSAREGGIWAPPGPAIDSAGNLYVATGNGSSSSFDHGNAVIRLTPTLRATGFFAPSDAGSLNASDSDLGSTGPILLPGARAFIIGKSGTGYLLNTNRLGGIGHALAARHVCDAAFGGLAYAHATIYVPCTSGIVAIRLAGLIQLWRTSTADLSPIVAGPAVWAIGSGTLYQLDARTGRVRYHASIGDAAHFATPAASGGRIYVAAGDQLHAFG